MSIEQKIAQILAESRAAAAGDLTESYAALSASADKATEKADSYGDHNSDEEVASPSKAAKLHKQAAEAHKKAQTAAKAAGDHKSADQHEEFIMNHQNGHDHYSGGLKEEVVAEEAKEGHLTTDGVTSVEGDNESNKKNNVDKQEIGGAGSKVSNVVNKGASAPEASHIAGIKEDVAALVDGEELTEEFKQKAAVIFEAAVMNRVKQEVAKLDEAYEVALAEQVEVIKEGLVEKVDGYLDYVVEQWIEQNEIALESGMKSEILEGFVSGLKGLFEEHYIDIPEEKLDVLGSLEEQVEGLTAKLDEQFEANVALKADLAKYQVAQVASSISEGLTDTDKEKFHALVEELEFDGIESFVKKAQTIRESYFTNKATTSVVNSIVTDTPVVITEEVQVAPQMKQYLSVLNNLK